MPDQPTFSLYNTLSRRVEPVETTEPEHLRMYACGPTVYSYAHIGNFRSFLTADLILRTARALGWKTTSVMNITDVGHLTEDDVADAGGEDRMAKALSSKEGERFANVWDLARYYAEALLRDWRTLGLMEPDVRPRATEHVRQQIQAVEQLIERGHAYETEQGVYFSVESFPGYGKLSGNQAADALVDGAAAESRDVVQDAGKRDPRDFALWKKDPRHLMQWHSPWGWGFPGWHIECSVMAMDYLGEQIDLHAGGEDLIFPHHECEIAQSESLTGKPFARMWVHTRFLQVEGKKMAKRTGNFFTVRDLVSPADDGGRGIDPLALRLGLIRGKYREPFNFTMAALKESAGHVRRIQETEARVRELARAGDDGADRVGSRLDAVYDRMLAAMCDDLNTPVAIAAVLEGVRLVNGMGDNLNPASARAALAWLDRVDDLLGIVRPLEAPAGPEAAEDPLAAQVEPLIEARTQARKDRDFARADALRDEIEALGVEIMDSPEGTRWRRAVDV